MRHVFAFAPATLLSMAAAQDDRLGDTKKADVLRVASFDINPPFGFVDPAAKQTAGLDVGSAQAGADAIDVRLDGKLGVRPTNPENRVPLLTSREVDLVPTNFTITEERVEQLDLSVRYSASGQQFRTKRGTLSSIDQLDGLRIGADEGTANEMVPRRDVPEAMVVAFAALRYGKLQATTQGGPELVGLLAEVPDRRNREIQPSASPNDDIGVGITKGESRLWDLVNETLLKLEKDGAATEICGRWFGPNTEQSSPRLLRIGDHD